MHTVFKLFTGDLMASKKISCNIPLNKKTNIVIAIYKTSANGSNRCLVTSSTEKFGLHEEG